MTATRETPGAISLSNSSHFALTPYSYRANPVMFPPGRARLEVNPAATGSMTIAKTMGIARVTSCSAVAAGVVEADYDVGHKRNQLRSVGAVELSFCSGPTCVDPHVLAIHPTELP